MQDEEIQSITIEYMHEVALAKRGILLSTEIPNEHYLLDWTCADGHDFPMQAKRVLNGGWCPKCHNKKPKKGQSFHDKFETKIGLWHPTKNGSITPKDVFANSGYKMWWQCEKNHNWYAQVQDIAEGRGCPYCANKLVCDDNCLETRFSSVAKEWHPTKNGTLTPKDILPGNNNKFWWKCEKEHEWEAVASSRTSLGTGCPDCFSSRQTSLQELVLYYALKELFPNCLHRQKIQTNDGEIEVDLFLEEYDTAIEYDGYYYHLNKVENDLRKNRLLKEKNINVIRLRENVRSKFLPSAFEETDLYLNVDYYDKNGLKEAVKKIGTFMIKQFQLPLEISNNLNYLDTLDFYGLKLKVLDDYKNDKTVNSIARSHAHVAEQWHPTKNGSLKPEHFTPSSNQKVWWICDHGHSWDARIDSRVAGNGCPYCSGTKPVLEESLAHKRKDLLEEWHFELNSPLSPYEIGIKTSNKVWWVCKKDKDHVWNTRIRHRANGSGCPYCSGRRATKETCLAAKSVFLTAEWSKSLNGVRTPFNTKPGSTYEAWWECSTPGCGHVWKKKVYNRYAYKKGCEKCEAKINQ